MNATVYQIWLSLALTPGGALVHKLFDRFGSAENIYLATEDDIAEVVGKQCRDLVALSDKDLTRAEEIYKLCCDKKIGILAYADDGYPKAFSDIPDPPALLYYRGTLPDFSSECFVSVVGTRRLTDYGRRNAYVIGYDLASAGAVTVSGMAIGIDGVAHAGALAAEGKNVAFLGCGIDRCYPSDHLTLAREIVKNGCIMTEYAPGTPPERFNFPKRNRLIAALSCATVVVEGKMTSGAVITARLARKYGKEIYALPGNVDNVTSEVANVLIQNGARLIISAVDVVKDLENVYLGKVFVGKIKPKPQTAMDEALLRYEISCVCPSDDIFTPARKKRTRKAPVNTEADEVRVTAVDIEARVPELDAETLCIYQKIPCEGDISVDELVDETDKLNKVMKALLKLEMGRFVTMLPGERVKRIL